MMKNKTQNLDAYQQDRNAHVLAFEKQQSDYKDLVKEQMRQNRLKKSKTLQPKMKKTVSFVDRMDEKPPEVLELEKQRSDYMDEVRSLMKKNR